MSFNPKIKKLLEKVMNTYNNNLKKSFNYPNWQPQSPLLLSKVDKETAQELFNLVKSLPNQDKKVEWGGFSDLGDTKGEPSVSVRSGWYIDYDREISCEPRSSAGSKIHDFGWVQVKTYRILTEKIENFQVGDREAGLLVKSDSEDSGTSTLKGSNGVNLSVPNRMQITEFFRGPLDSALFELPTEFQLKF